MTLSLWERLIFSIAYAWIVLRHPKHFRVLRGRLARQGVRSNPALPRCAEDKGLWRRVLDHDPRFVTTSDKIAVKDWVTSVCPDVRIPKVLWQGTNPDDLPEEIVKGTCVVKTNNGCRTNTFVRAGDPDHATIVERGRAHIAMNHAKRNYEWGYLSIQPKLFVEEMIPGEGPLTDMKIHTVGGDIVYFLCLADRFGTPRRCYWEPDDDGGWRPSELKPHDGSDPDPSTWPDNAAEALDIARRLGAHFDYMRVDLLTDGQSVWFGELTAYPGGGRWHEIGHLAEHPLNTGWDLRKSWLLSTPQRGFWRLYCNALRNVLDRA
ncbi:MAG: ATP-grasp fold amidoligase family protein [Pseudomonadota bacterium]